MVAKSRRIHGAPIDYDVPHDILYMPPYSRDDGILLCVNRAGIVSTTPPNFHIRRDDSYRYGVIHCIMGGSGSMIFRDREYPVGKGQLFLLPPGEAHEYRSSVEEPMGLCWVEFYGGNSPAVIRHILGGDVVYGGATFDTVLSLCTQVILRLEKPGQIAEISVLLYQMLMELLVASGALGGTAARPEGFAEILDYIDQNLGRRLTIEALAEQFGYHPTYLARKFAADFGTTPAKYILRQRIIRSCELLLGTNRTLEQIAGETGFYDASHFISKFKQSEGVTPLHYRRQNHGLAPPAD